MAHFFALQKKAKWFDFYPSILARPTESMKWISPSYLPICPLLSHKEHLVHISFQIFQQNNSQDGIQYSHNDTCC